MKMLTLDDMVEMLHVYLNQETVDNFIKEYSLAKHDNYHRREMLFPDTTAPYIICRAFCWHNSEHGYRYWFNMYEGLVTEYHNRKART